jgi:hypothetical protein
MPDAEARTPLVQRCAAVDVSIVDRFADALWMENGLSENTLGRIGVICTGCRCG